jgi:hypothetical protein
MARNNIIWAHGFDLFIININVKIGQNSLRCANLFDPCQCLFHMGVAWMRTITQRIDDPQINYFLIFQKIHRANHERRANKQPCRQRYSQLH